jgi:hypothetical protein
MNKDTNPGKVAASGSKAIGFDGGVTTRNSSTNNEEIKMKKTDQPKSTTTEEKPNVAKKGSASSDVKANEDKSETIATKENDLSKNEISVPKKNKVKNKNASARPSWQEKLDDPNYTPKKKKIKVAGKEVEIDKPPKVLMIIWILILAELGLDLVTSAIAFLAFLKDPEVCCDVQINSGIGPLAVATPFFFLVMSELIFLLRAIVLFLGPNVMAGEDGDIENAPISKKIVCCRKWSPKFILWLVNFLTVINPFFGFAIAWMLMYQSDKTEALTVMGIELVTIILHFISVHLEKSAKSCHMKLIHGIIIIPLLATVGVNVWFVIHKGGVCYDSSLETFWYKGCEVCEDGSPAIADSEFISKCPTTLSGSNETTYEFFNILSLDSNTTCTGEKNVCWFSYE